MTDHNMGNRTSDQEHAAATLRLGWQVVWPEAAAEGLAPAEHQRGGAHLMEPGTPALRWR